MKKKIISVICKIITVIIALIALFLISTGFHKRTDVVLTEYSVSADGTKLTFKASVWSSIGYTRGYKDKGGGVKPHYLTFYSTFGGLNSSFGARNEFELDLAETDTEIYFNRPGGGYELVLQKNVEIGEWIKPSQISAVDNSDEIITYNGKEYKKSELSNATLDWLALSEHQKMASSYLPVELMEIVEINEEH